MQTFYFIACALACVVAVYLLVKKVETKVVFIGAGMVLCLISLQPLEALKAFTETMTRAGVIKAICASMGFAFVMKATKCDAHLVKLLTAPLKNLGFLLIPIAYTLTFFISIAIPSAAGCVAAVGPTLIPLMMAAGVRPAMAATSVLAGTLGGILSPGTSHNNIIADMAKVSIPEVIKTQTSTVLIAGGITLVCLIVMTFVFRDYKKGEVFINDQIQKEEDAIKQVNLLYAMMPIVPLALLLIGAGEWSKSIDFLAWTHRLGVAEAMLLGAMIAIVATWTKPDKISKEFFDGMGHSYANIIGIIIAASVFVAGLKACGVVDAIVEWLKVNQDYVRFGGTFIPFFMAVLTGSGDAPAIAFNDSITIKAAELGFDQIHLGTTVALSAVLGRVISPVLAASIIAASLAGTNTIEIVKRTALGSLISLFVIAFVLL